MFGGVIWLLSNVLEVLILIRGWRSKLMHGFPVFYSYIMFVFLQSILRFAVYHWHGDLYASVYWATEFAAVVIGCGIVFEIYRVGLAAYPGAARMVRGALGLIFGVACLEVVVASANHPQWWRMATVWELERNLRTVQALAIAALLLLFLFYSLRFGRNLNGILLGYSLFVGVSIIQLTFVGPISSTFGRVWGYLHPISYDISLAIWLGYLWSFEPHLTAATTFELRGGYRRIAALTERRLRETRADLRKAVGS